MKNLHCCLDEKFIDGVFSLFNEDATAANEYIFVRNEEKYDFKYIKHANVKILNKKAFLKYTENYDNIFLHSLESTFFDFKLIENIPKRKNVIWFSWGVDIYSNNYPVVNINLYGAKTKEIISSQFGFFQCIIKKLKSIKYLLFTQKHHIAAMQRVDYYSGVFPYEYNLVKDSVPDFRAFPVDFYYGSTNFFIPEKPCSSEPGKLCNIMVGNSGAETNNHVDAFEYIKKIKHDNDSKVIVPISYAGSSKYKKAVINRGYELFGDSFMPLTGYLPIDEYLNIVSNCKSAIFFHERQQASDNVFMQLQFGARVFMSKNSLMYQYLKKMGFVLFSLQEDYALLNKPLEYDSIMKNRELLSQNYSSSHLIDRVKRINLILKEKANK